MKYFLLLSLLAIAPVTWAGRIKDMSENPEQMAQFIQTANYDSLLQLIKDAATERKAHPSDEVLEYAYTLILNETPLSMQIPMALDFTLLQADLPTRRLGARAIYQALLQGIVPGDTLKSRLLTKLKADLAAAIPSTQDGYDFARYEVYVLILLNDDVGLNTLLTDTETVRTLQGKDSWTSSSTAAALQQLSTLYTQQAGDPANPDSDWDKTLAAFYTLAATRRTNGVALTSNQPVLNLDALVKR